ncbi:MAG TPA: hypothetical protein VH814_24215 [Steroidobacteraceae bacterium]
MLTYQIRPRVLRLDSDQVPSWPADVVIELHFSPGQPFGTSRTGGRTAVRNEKASLIVNANNGQTEVQSSRGLKPLEVVVEWPDRRCELKGNMFTMTVRANSLSELEDDLQSAYYAMPTLLNAFFVDPPFVTHVGGTLNGVKFRWELARFKTRVETTDQSHQETLGGKAIVGLATLGKGGRRRLFGALHYFHVASRLARASATAGEFMAETLLNLAKTLEVLFPGDRESVRRELIQLGYTTAEVEAKFMPAMLLRSKVDSAHVLLSLFNIDQLKTLHAYTLDAEDAFRELMARVLTRIEEGSFEPHPYEVRAVDAELVKLVETLKANLPSNS